MTEDRLSFNELLSAQWAEGRYLCVGLDTDVKKIPESFCAGEDPAIRLLEYNKRIIDATSDLVCAYKPNSAFYEALGSSGIDALEKTIDLINTSSPSVPVIVDAKRADIDNTNIGYVSFIFEYLGADAVTVHPYLGGEALAPFLRKERKGVFVLARTSNNGAAEFQDLEVDGRPLYLAVAERVATGWNSAGNCGLVVGATYPEELRLIREAVPATMPILVPGIGSQGGDLEAAVAAGSRSGECALIINASRSIIFASEGDDFEERARAEAHRLSEGITRAVSSLSPN